MRERRFGLEQNLWNRVRAAFPSQTCSTLRLEQSGGDHLLLIVDENRAFRFPRPGKHGLGLEISVLECLRGQARVAIPAYDLVDPDGGFAGYPLIPGVQLTPARFSALSIDAGRTVLADTLVMLKLLHALEPHLVMPIDRWPRMWSSGQFADRIANERLLLLANRLPVLAMPIAAFLDRYRIDRAPRDIVLHGDLVCDHLLIDETTDRLAGIIDFSDVALGDPAHDLLGFWTYGAPAAAYAVKCCADADTDPTLFARSHRHFVRYEIDRLYESIVDGASDRTIQQHGTKVIELIAASLRADPITGEYDG
ncbi:aminoglycoside phosphotransferase family protein [Sphingomonas sp. GC_Shp_2]|nr:aminoglycoside phosphotransferase family protein [Sphingomonas sp. GC_Shp_2]